MVEQFYEEKDFWDWYLNFKVSEVSLYTFFYLPLLVVINKLTIITVTIPYLYFVITIIHTVHLMKKYIEFVYLFPSDVDRQLVKAIKKQYKKDKKNKKRLIKNLKIQKPIPQFLKDKTNSKEIKSKICSDTKIKSKSAAEKEFDKVKKRRLKIYIVMLKNRDKKIRQIHKQSRKEEIKKQKK